MAHVIPAFRTPRSRRSPPAIAPNWRRSGAWTLVGIAILLLLSLIAGLVAEVDIGKFIANIDKFTSYFGRLFFLDTGASVFTDIKEWFWGLSKWSAKLFDTLLIAYLGNPGRRDSGVLSLLRGGGQPDAATAEALLRPPFP